MKKNIPHFAGTFKRVVLFDDKVQYIKDNLHMTESPMGGNYTVEQVDAMVYLVKNDWKESGHMHYEWIDAVYDDMMRTNRDSKHIRTR